MDCNQFSVNYIQIESMSGEEGSAAWEEEEGLGEGSAETAATAVKVVGICYRQHRQDYLC